MRNYTNEYLKIKASIFKQVSKIALGRYSFSFDHDLSKEHKTFNLVKGPNGERVAVFNIKGSEQRIRLVYDNSSASNKLYITCPHCNLKKQHLYIVANAYACRRCLSLHYRSQSQSNQDRLGRRIRTLRLKLWGKEHKHSELTNLFNHNSRWGKPKWMRWHNYFRKLNELISYEEKYWALSLKQLDKLYSSVNMR
jgi:hypothetical protein